MKTSSAARWRYAAKPDSWGKLLVPFALGQAMGLGPALDQERNFSVARALFALAFTVFDLLFIVFLNDYFDAEVDAIKRRMFPTGCSPKTIPDKILTASQLLFAGLAMGMLALLTALGAEVLLGVHGATLTAVASLGIFIAYSAKPLRLNYRGGGELLEMLGVGIVLPWISALMQGNAWTSHAMVFLPGFALLSLASAIASGLADERSDRMGGKRTVVTMIGNTLSRRAIEALSVLGALAWMTAAFFEMPLWVAIPAGLIVLVEVPTLRKKSAAAETDAFDAQRAYKGTLHTMIRHGALGLGVLLVIYELS